jgi:hypothetical protein
MPLALVAASGCSNGSGLFELNLFFDDEELSSCG